MARPSRRRCRAASRPASAGDRRTRRPPRIPGQERVLLTATVMHPTPTLPFLLAVATLLLPSAAQQRVDAAAKQKSHARMVATLHDIAVRARSDHKYHGDAAAKALWAEMAQLGDQAGWKLRLDGALAHLRLGATRQGIAILEGARDALAKGGDRRRRRRQERDPLLPRHGLAAPRRDRQLLRPQHAGELHPAAAGRCPAQRRPKARRTRSRTSSR
jgi:hypothetical protein